MLDLIWLLGGGCEGGAAGGVGWVGLGAECWVDDTGDGGVLEFGEGPGSAESFCTACGCFLGIVKVLLLTRRAPDTWWRDPGGPGGDKTGIGSMGGPGFFGLACMGIGCFLNSLPLLKCAALVFPLGRGEVVAAAAFVPLEPGDFFPPLGVTFEAGGFFSGDAVSFSGLTSSLSSFSLSFWAAAGKQIK